MFISDIKNKLYNIFYILRAIKYYIKRNFLFYNKSLIIQRGACLTNDSLKILYPNANVLNFQKSRVDLLNAQYEYRCNPNLFDVSLVSPALYNLYIDQFSGFWAKLHNKEILIIDSYSELTDQLFINSKDYRIRFCANFSDVKSDFSDYYFCSGLLDNSEIFLNYDLFFSRIREVNPDLKIIYVFFPMGYEKRVKYIDRNFFIEDAINKLVSKYNINMIKVPEELLEVEREDDFPYHYNESVYKYIANKLNNTYGL
jgi:hypothetical protein